MYSVKKFGVSIVETDLNIIMRESLKHAPILRLKTLDLLHTTVAKAVGAKSIATLAAFENVPYSIFHWRPVA
jgi:hypothetical protein